VGGAFLQHHGEGIDPDAVMGIDVGTRYRERSLEYGHGPILERAQAIVQGVAQVAAGCDAEPIPAAALSSASRRTPRVAQGFPFRIYLSRAALKWRIPGREAMPRST